MDGTITYTTPDGGITSQTVATTPCTGGYWLNGLLYEWPAPNYPVSYVYTYTPTTNATEKAFAVAKHLLAKKRVKCATPQEFIALVEELKEVL